MNQSFDPDLQTLGVVPNIGAYIITNTIVRGSLL